MFQKRHGARYTFFLCFRRFLRRCLAIAGCFIRKKFTGNEMYFKKICTAKPEEKFGKDGDFTDITPVEFRGGSRD